MRQNLMQLEPLLPMNDFQTCLMLQRISIPNYSIYTVCMLQHSGGFLAFGHFIDTSVRTEIPNVNNHGSTYLYQGPNKGVLLIAVDLCGRRGVTKLINLASRCVSHCFAHCIVQVLAHFHFSAFCLFKGQSKSIKDTP